MALYVADDFARRQKRERKNKNNLQKAFESKRQNPPFLNQVHSPSRRIREAQKAVKSQHTHKVASAGPVPRPVFGSSVSASTSAPRRCCLNGLIDSTSSTNATKSLAVDQDLFGVIGSPDKLRALRTLEHAKNISHNVKADKNLDLGTQSLKRKATAACAATPPRPEARSSGAIRSPVLTPFGKGTIPPIPRQPRFDGKNMLDNYRLDRIRGIKPSAVYKDLASLATKPMTPLKRARALLGHGHDVSRPIVGIRC